MIVFKNSYFFIFIFVILCGLIKCHDDDDKSLDFSKPINRDAYVDPHSLYYNKHAKKEEVKKELVKSTNNQIHNSTDQKCKKVLNDCLNGKIKDVPDEMFSRRLINMLLALAVFEENDSRFTSTIAIEISKDELKKLKDFGLGKATIRDVDSIIVDVFKSTSNNAFLRTFFTFKNFDFPSLWIYKEVIIGSLITLYITWMLIKSHWTIFRVICFSILIIFVVSFLITYLQLYEEAKIKLIAKQFQYTEIPIQCQPNKMSWFDRISTVFAKEDHCEKYYEAMMENPLLKVTPAQALSHMLATFSFQPLRVAGTAISEFIHIIIRFMPWWSQYIMEPIMIILFVIAFLLITIVVIYFLMGGSLSFGYGLFKISPPQRPNLVEDNRSLSSKEKREPIEFIVKVQVSSDNSIQQIKPESLTKNDSPEIPAIKNELNIQSEEKVENINSTKLPLENNNSERSDEISKSSTSETTEVDDYEIIQNISYSGSD